MKALAKRILVALLTWEARQVVKKYKPQIVAVTGSVGKTSTKDAIYTVLESSVSVRKSMKSFNSDIGVPLTILGAENPWSNPFAWLGVLWQGAMLLWSRAEYPSWLVLEVGADHPGDIKNLARWLLVDVVVLTRLPDVPVHVEFFSSPEAVAEEKLSLLRALKPDGVAVLNADDERIIHARTGMAQQCLTYGFLPGADVVASNEIVQYESALPSGMTFKINHAGSSVPVVLKGALGVQHIYPLLAAAAVGTSINLNLLTISQSLATHVPPPGRMHLIPGIKNSVIIDDTYNSSPIALEEALHTLREVRVRGRKIAIIGDMLELGPYATEAHYRAGKQAAAATDLLMVMGAWSAETVRGARDAEMPAGNIFTCENVNEIVREVSYLLDEGDIVLAKGSQGMRLEKVVEQLMAEPERASEFLVRQDTEWKKR